MSEQHQNLSREELLEHAKDLERRIVRLAWRAMSEASPEVWGVVFAKICADYVKAFPEVEESEALLKAVEHLTRQLPIHVTLHIRDDENKSNVIKDSEDS